MSRPRTAYGWIDSLFHTQFTTYLFQQRPIFWFGQEWHTKSSFVYHTRPTGGDLFVGQGLPTERFHTQFTTHENKCPN